MYTEEEKRYFESKNTLVVPDHLMRLVNEYMRQQETSPLSTALPGKETDHRGQVARPSKIKATRPALKKAPFQKREETASIVLTALPTQEPNTQPIPVAMYFVSIPTLNPKVSISHMLTTVPRNQRCIFLLIDGIRSIADISRLLPGKPIEVIQMIIEEQERKGYLKCEQLMKTR